MRIKRIISAASCCNNKIGVVNHPASFFILFVILPLVETTLVLPVQAHALTGSLSDRVRLGFIGQPVDPLPRPALTGLVATTRNNNVALTWTPLNGATSYNVYRSTVSGGPYTVISHIGAVIGAK